MRGFLQRSILSRAGCPLPVLHPLPSTNGPFLSLLSVVISHDPGKVAIVSSGYMMEGAYCPWRTQSPGRRFSSLLFRRLLWVCLRFATGFMAAVAFHSALSWSKLRAQLGSIQAYQRSADCINHLAYLEVVRMASHLPHFLLVAVAR